MTPCSPFSAANQCGAGRLCPGHSSQPQWTWSSPSAGSLLPQFPPPEPVQEGEHLQHRLLHKVPFWVFWILLGMAGNIILTVRRAAETATCPPFGEGAGPSPEVGRPLLGPSLRRTPGEPWALVGRPLSGELAVLSASPECDTRFLGGMRECCCGRRSCSPVPPSRSRLGRLRVTAQPRLKRGCSAAVSHAHRPQEDTSRPRAASQQPFSANLW